MFSGLESPMHLLIVLIVAVLVLGPKKLPEVGRSLGSGIRQFKDTLEGGGDKPDKTDKSEERATTRSGRAAQSERGRDSAEVREAPAERRFAQRRAGRRRRLRDG